MKPTIVLGISSSIAAEKSIALITLLQQKATVIVIMSKNATKMVDKNRIEKLTGNKVYVDLFEEKIDYEKILSTRHVEHIDLADKATLFVVAPATANIVAKLAHGIADDYLTTVALATTAPVVIAPAMNVHMWQHPATQTNITKLKSFGYHIIEPIEGILACGYSGKGKMEDIQKIYEDVSTYLDVSTDFAGKKVIVTAGGTQEPIDDVRFISNRSSGKMGIALAENLFFKGADVLLLRSKNAVKPRVHVPEEVFTTSEDLYQLIKSHTKHADYFFHAAAVSDFSITKHTGKLSSKQKQTVTFHPAKKIINEIKKINPHVFLVGFKAEAEKDAKKLILIAQKKLKESGANLIIANDISSSDKGFESDQNEVYIVSNHNNEHISLASKKIIAEEITQYVKAHSSK